LAVVDHEIRRIAEGRPDTTIGSVGGSTQVAAAEDVVALQRGLFVGAEGVAAEERAEVDEIKEEIELGVAEREDRRWAFEDRKERIKRRQKGGAQLPFYETKFMKY
jgi:hypothetical protein